MSLRDRIVNESSRDSDAREKTKTRAIDFVNMLSQMHGSLHVLKGQQPSTITRRIEKARKSILQAQDDLRDIIEYIEAQD